MLVDVQTSTRPSEGHLPAFPRKRWCVRAVWRARVADSSFASTETSDGLGEPSRLMQGATSVRDLLPAGGWQRTRLMARPTLNREGDAW